MAEHKNPYVHPAPEKGMLNQASNDGWSFDEYDDEGKPTPKIIKPGETPPWLRPSGPGAAPVANVDTKTQAALEAKFAVPPASQPEADAADKPAMGVAEATQAFLNAKSDGREAVEKAAVEVRRAQAAAEAGPGCDRAKMAEAAFSDLLRDAGQSGLGDEHSL